MSKLRNLVGQKFGRLSVVARGDNSKIGQAYWWCECECGGKKLVRGTHLSMGVTTSCGCYSQELRTKHGMAGTPEYRAYYNMIKRCEYEDDSSYLDYGGRGIKVCPEWRNSFERFLSDMGHRPSDYYSIDRIECNGDYEPGNCRWASLEDQEHNKRIRWDSTTGVRGVRRDKKTGKYIADIYANGKTRRIGTFEKLEDAAKARCTAEKKYWVAAT